MEKTYYIKSDLRNELKRLDKKFDHEKSKDHASVAKILNKVLDNHDFYTIEYPELMNERNALKEDIKELTQENEIQAEQIQQWEAQSNTSGYELINKFELGKWLIEIKSKK